MRRLLDAWGLPLAVLAFLMPLCAAWELEPGSGNTAFAALFGRIPWGDAHGHFEGAQRLLAESLTNSLKHGDLAAPVEVDEDWRDGYRLVVRNRVRRRLRERSDG